MTRRGQLSRSNKFSVWRRKVDRLMNLEYAITIVDAGIDDFDLRKHWGTRMHATEFVKWFGVKYDLTSVTEWNRSLGFMR